MYGLVLEAIGDAIVHKYGEEVWNEIRQKAGITHQNFVTHKKYSETVIPRLAKAAQEITKTPLEELMDIFGTTFVSFVAQYGYDRILRVLGRHLRDFLNGLDNLHEYLRFSYPKLKPPSFFCEQESRSGLVLHYRSKRKGFLHYVMGQICAVGLQFYNTPIEIKVLKNEETLDMTHVVMQLSFDNSAYMDMDEQSRVDVDPHPIGSEVFFDVFPFNIVFNRTMTIRNIGSGLQSVMPELVGQAVDEMFVLSRPLVEFTLENVMMHTNNVFELTSIDPVQRCVEDDHSNMLNLVGTDEIDPDDPSRRLRLKGQMMYMKEWDAIIFLGTPIMDDLEKMFDSGLYINDLSMHDSSRDLVLAGTQQSAELKLALDQEQQKSKKLEESMKKLDVEMKRTDSLLYQMIPKAVADRLRSGEAAMDTCEVFEQVTILFSDVVGFTRICSQITPMQVVSMLNSMYTQFDKLSEKHRVYKVETIGDAYMVVSGAPVVTKFHALYISDMAFDMLETMRNLIDPSTGSHMKIRVGLHSGTVVAGVVGLKMPRYCLFGDTVNTASRMESSGEAMKIHISETTYEHLEEYPAYIVEERGTIEVKGKGTLQTYWLLEKADENALMDNVAAMMDMENIDGNANVSFDPGDDSDADRRSLYSPVMPEDVRRSQLSMNASRANLEPGDRRRNQQNLSTTRGGVSARKQADSSSNRYGSRAAPANGRKYQVSDPHPPAPPTDLISIASTTQSLNSAVEASFGPGVSLSRAALCGSRDDVKSCGENFIIHDVVSENEAKDQTSCTRSAACRIV